MRKDKHDGVQTMIGKQAKVLKTKDVERALAHVNSLTYPERNVVMILLSTKAGLRAKEISELTWSMVLSPDGSISDHIHLPSSACKGSSGRIIPLHEDLRQALERLRGVHPNLALHESEDRAGTKPTGQQMSDDSPKVAHTPVAHVRVIYSKHGSRMHACNVAHWFRKIYRALGLEGCSSHSGRRTFITHAARKVSLVGGSLRDVQLLAGHKSLAMTQRYVEANTQAQRALIKLL